MSFCGASLLIGIVLFAKIRVDAALQSGRNFAIIVGDLGNKAKQIRERLSKSGAWSSDALSQAVWLRALNDGYPPSFGLIRAGHTICINKTSSTELTKAINSMFPWSGSSQICYAYLADYDASDFP